MKRKKNKNNSNKKQKYVSYDDKFIKKINNYYKELEAKDLMSKDFNDINDNTNKNKMEFLEAFKSNLTNNGKVTKMKLENSLNFYTAEIKETLRKLKNMNGTKKENSQLGFGDTYNFDKSIKKNNDRLNVISDIADMFKIKVKSL